MDDVIYPPSSRDTQTTNPTAMALTMMPMIVPARFMLSATTLPTARHIPAATDRDGPHDEPYRRGHVRDDQGNHRKADSAANDELGEVF